LCDQLARRIHRDGISIKDKLIVAADRVTIANRPLIGAASAPTISRRIAGLCKVNGDALKLTMISAHARPGRAPVRYRKAAVADNAPSKYLHKGSRQFLPHRSNGSTLAGRFEIAIFIENVVAR
jgi:hypothetical protein